MSDQPSSAIGEKIVDGLKQANKVIQARFIFIGLLMIIAVSLLYLRSKADKDNAPTHFTFDLYHKYDLLRQMRDTSDLESFIKSHMSDLELLTDMDNGALLFKLKNANYKDRLPIAEEMTKMLQALSARRNLDAKKIFEEPTSIGGINIPIELWLYFVPFILAVLFRDLGRVFGYRRVIIERFKELGLEEWQQGVGLLGFQLYGQDNGVFRISRMFDIIISSILLFMPLACSLLFAILISYFTQNFRLILGELICTLSIGVDLLIIYYRENIFGFRTLVDLSTGKSSLSIRGKKYISIMIWIVIPILAYGISSNITFIFDEQEKRTGIYEISIILTSILLAISLWLCSRYHESKWLIRVRFTLFVMNIYWIFVVLFLFYIRRNFYRLARSYAAINFIEILLLVAIITYLISLYLWPIRWRKLNKIQI